MFSARKWHSQIRCDKGNERNVENRLEGMSLTGTPCYKVITVDRMSLSRKGQTCNFKARTNRDWISAFFEVGLSNKPCFLSNRKFRF